ncbi:hypothetical protein RRF57_003217 [Xylaria bambusicola]|uniref:Uncharacterized protein n=1 Tax=Xylaria bambusicola TaxID=326684 RepID=A0AAN7Z367_9PEZI
MPSDKNRRETISPLITGKTTICTRRKFLLHLHKGWVLRLLKVGKSLADAISALPDPIRP